MRLKGIKRTLVVLTVLVLCVGLSGLVYAEKGGKKKGDTVKNRGDNRDDARSGKVDRIGDGNSGQGDDLHQPRKRKGKFDKNELTKRWKKRCHEMYQRRKHQRSQREGVRDGDREDREGQDSRRQKMIHKWKKLDPEEKTRFKKRWGHLDQGQREALRQHFTKRRHQDGTTEGGSHYRKKPGQWKNSARCEKMRNLFRKHRGKPERSFEKGDKKHSNRGVRDHGKGEGRDGAGQGKAKGKVKDKGHKKK